MGRAVPDRLGISNNTRAFWNIAKAKRLSGYPEDDSEVRYAADVQRLVISQAHGRRLGGHR